MNVLKKYIKTLRNVHNYMLARVMVSNTSKTGVHGCMITPKMSTLIIETITLTVKDNLPQELKLRNDQMCMCTKFGQFILVKLLLIT